MERTWRTILGKNPQNPSIGQRRQVYRNKIPFRRKNHPSGSFLQGIIEYSPNQPVSEPLMNRSLVLFVAAILVSLSVLQAKQICCPQPTTRIPHTTPCVSSCSPSCIPPTCLCEGENSLKRGPQAGSNSPQNNRPNANEISLVHVLLFGDTLDAKIGVNCAQSL